MDGNVAVRTLTLPSATPIAFSIPVAGTISASPALFLLA
jgi:hypothetical protein